MAITLRMYAEHKGYALHDVTIQLRHKRVDSKDCDDCTTSTGLIDEITSTIYLNGDLDNNQRKRLIEVASRCPVHRTLNSEIQIKVKEGNDHDTR